MLWCFFLVPRVGAVVAEAELAYWGGAIVVSVLAAGGMALATGDAQKVGSAMYAALKDTGGKAWDSIQAMAVWAASAGSKVKDAAFRVGKDVWQAITDCFNKSYSDGSFLISGNSFSFDASEFNPSAQSTIDDFNNKHYSSVSVISSAGIYRASIYLVGSKDWGMRVSTPTGTDNYESMPGAFGAVELCSSLSSGYYFRYVTYKSNGDVFSTSSKKIWLETASDTVVTGYYGCDVSLSGDLVYPGDDYLVKAPDLPAVDTNTGAVSWPSDAVYNKDAIALPYPIDAAGEKVADIPYDVPVDQTTGKDIADAGSDTDTPGKPGEGEGTETGTTVGLIGTIISLLKNFFDSPSDFKLNMDGFRNLAIADKFPFCIPFDMVDSVKQFAANAADYQFRVKLDTQSFKVDHVVDLTPLAVPLAFFRYLVVAWFAWVLMSRTHDLMKW